MTARPTILGLAALAAVMGVVATPALAQTRPDSEIFLEAIEAQDNDKVIDLATRKGRAVVNSRGYSGATPLTVAVRKRLGTYVNFLLQKGADPDLAEKNGDTALMIAARSGYLEGINSMLTADAAVDATNRQGETALIIAVQNRQVAAVKRLLEAGASVTRTDSASGLSARDYALRDRRSGELLRLIDSVRAKPKPKFIAGPIIQ
jgi:ankyrin repeat protein